MKPDDVRKIKMFCIPFAGGSASMYNKWKKRLDSSIELIPVELSGRGKRLQEPLYEDSNAAIDDVFNIVRKQIGDDPYVLFGHSMGR